MTYNEALDIAAVKLFGFGDYKTAIKALKGLSSTIHDAADHIVSIHNRATEILTEHLQKENAELRDLTSCECGDVFNKDYRGKCPNCIVADATTPRTDAEGELSRFLEFAKNSSHINVLLYLAEQFRKEGGEG